MRRPGRSFAALVALGVAVELGGAAVAILGLDTLARCYLAGFTNSHTRSPAVCMEPISGVGFHLFVPVAILVALLCISAALAVLHVAGSLGDAKRLERLLGPRRSRTPSDLSNAAQAVGLSKIDVRDHAEPYAICLGVLRPRVVVSTALLGVLTLEELVAVVAHEESHRRRRAPLRRLVAKAAARGFFYLPILSDLSDAHVIEEEIAADTESTGLVGALPLVRALQKLSGAHHPDRAPCCAFGDVSTLSYRLRAIHEHKVARPALRRLGAALSAASLCGLALLVLWMPLAGVR